MQHLPASSLTCRAPWARSAVLWLLLALAVALASPLVHPRSVELLCTGTGSVKLLVGGADDADLNTGQGHDCTLCAQASAPPAQALNETVSAQPDIYAQSALPAARQAWPAAPPLPARGPPNRLLA
jgi:hypothetical protein